MRPTQYKITDGQIAARLGVQRGDVNLAADVLGLPHEEIIVPCGDWHGDRRARRYPISATEAIGGYFRKLPRKL